MVLRAPAAGVVYYGACIDGKWSTASTVRAKLRPGGRIAAREIVVTVVEPLPMFLRAEVAEKQLQHLKTGLTGRATAVANPNWKLNAIINSIGRVPVSDGKFSARLAVEGPDVDKLMPGMNCKGKFIDYQNRNALKAPKKAVFSDLFDDQLQHVFVKQDDGAAKRRPVQVGRTVGDEVEILNGLSVGDVILLEEPKE